MPNSIKDNMFIGYIILGAFGISGLALLYYKNKDYFYKNKKQESSEEENQTLLNKSRRQRINDISRFNDIEIAISNDYSSQDLNDISKENISERKNNRCESIEKKSEEVSININECSSDSSNEAESNIKKEFDWLIV
jgi:hypothetical protein